ncbi:DUF2267 domain-containing protein [Kitasatospora sp. NPDC048343]|uniref:DUF2267 domain-containing protein n=1 Tax=Kitasatospora sp. NPDC048343 TaxID=3154717 RepID=UPI0033D4CD33
MPCRLRMPGSSTSRRLRGARRRHAVYRLLRAWLHTLRDRLPIDAAVHFGAQLPTLIRGVYYEGWDPHPTPVKFDRQEYLNRFCYETSLAEENAEKAVRAVTGALFLHMPPEQLGHVFNALPHGLRSLITPAV